MLQAVARECRTINYTFRFGGLCSRWVAWKIMKMQPRELCIGSYAMEGGAMQRSRKVIVGVIVHELTARRWLRGEGGRHLRQKYLNICHQNSINCHNFGGTVGFEFKNPYKLRLSIQQRTLWTLRVVVEIYYLFPMNRSSWDDLVASPKFSKFSELN